MKEKLNIYYLYLYENKINGKIYIGQTTNPSRRHGEHCSFSENTMPIDRAINKYGKNNFNFSIILTADTSDQINQEEIYWIARMREHLGHRNVYNISDGASTPLTEASKQKISQSKMGSKNAFFGKKHTEKTKKILSDYALGNTHRRGKHTSLETKAKLSKAFSGEKNPNCKLTLTQVKEIKELYSTNIYSQLELSKKFNVALITISRLLRNKNWKI